MSETFFQRIIKKEEKEAIVVPVKDMVLFPYIVTPVFFEREETKAAINEAFSSNRQIIIASQKNKKVDHPQPEDIYEVATLANVPQVRQLPEGVVVAVVDGISRVKIKLYTQEDPYFLATYDELKLKYDYNPEEEALFRSVVDQFKQIIQLGKAVALEGLISIFDLKDPVKTTDVIAFSMDMPNSEKQALLEESDFHKRLQALSGFLAKEVAVLQTSQRIQHRTSEEIGKMQKEVYLREQLKSIEKELGIDEEQSETTELRKKIEDAQMPEEAKKTALEEYERLKKMTSYSPEIAWVRTYLDWLTDLPWSKETKDRLDLKEAQKILDEDHYGLEKVKEMILEYLALMKLAGKSKGPILLFVGPPGTGKTSIGRSIARAMNKKFVRISLGGVRDEAEIKGFRRTYVGAQPGRIIQGIKSAGTRNPVFMLDEMDKVGADFRGDPSAALLEALDPEQNNNFQDHYIETPFDLSDVVFIGTANILDTIPAALRDRTEVVPFSGYTIQEKTEIAKKYLVPKLLKSSGLTEKNVNIDDNAIVQMIKDQTREAGVRNLERQIAMIFRKIAREITEYGSKGPFNITAKSVGEYLGAPKFYQDEKEQNDEIGVSPALAWSEAGGLVLYIEAQPLIGHGNLTLTGKLGDVMKESAEAALSYARAHADEFGYDPRFYENTDLHIHVPEGAIPKDGPSAGIAITTAIVSALSKRPVRKDIAMTGEVTLRGKVLPVGGIKEKVLAGESLGANTIILPKENEKDLEELPDEVRKRLKFIMVSSMNEVLKNALK